MYTSTLVHVYNVQYMVHVFIDLLNSRTAVYVDTVFVQMCLYTLCRTELLIYVCCIRIGIYFICLRIHTDPKSRYGAEFVGYRLLLLVHFDRWVQEKAAFDTNETRPCYYYSNVKQKQTTGRFDIDLV